MRAILLTVMTCIGAFGVAHAATDTKGGEVRVPLETYRQLVEHNRSAYGWMAAHLRVDHGRQRFLLGQKCPRPAG